MEKFPLYAGRNANSCACQVLKLKNGDQVLVADPDNILILQEPTESIATTAQRAFLPSKAHGKERERDKYCDSVLKALRNRIQYTPRCRSTVHYILRSSQYFTVLLVTD